MGISPIVHRCEAETGACLEVIPGTGDVTAIAAGARLLPWQAIARALETVIEDAAAGQVIARFPHALEHTKKPPVFPPMGGFSG